MNSDIIIGSNAFIVTFKCNLRCKLCSTGTPFREQADFSLDYIIKTAKREFEIVKYFHKFTLTGGEPFLHKELPEIIRFFANYRHKIETLEIITNGTLIPRKEIMDELVECKDFVFILVDNYGTLSPQASACAEILEQNGVQYKLRCYYGDSAYCGGWLNQGDFSKKRETSVDTLKKCITQQFKNNTAVSQENWNEDFASDEFFIKYICTVDGLISRCARAYSTFKEGKIGNKPTNFVNLNDRGKTAENLKSDLYNMFSSDCYEPCEYCNGYYSDGERFPPAEQLLGSVFKNGGI